MSEFETPDATSGVQQVTIRRAPRLGVFLLAGSVLGALATLILTSLYPADPKIGFTATVGYFMLYGVPFGFAVGALVGLLFDRRASRRARTVEVEHQRVD